MQVKVLYFAALREAVGSASETWDLPESVRTAGELRDWLAARGDPWKSAFANAKRLRMAVSRVYARDDTPLAQGAEVAFFPPVTGG